MNCNDKRGIGKPQSEHEVLTLAPTQMLGKCSNGTMAEKDYAAQPYVIIGYWKSRRSSSRPTDPSREVAPIDTTLLSDLQRGP